MDSLLLDLYHHQAWADARHLRAIATHPPAFRDPVIQHRLLHVHTVQRFFLWMARDQEGTFAPATPDDIADLNQWTQTVRGYHDEVLRFVGALPGSSLSRSVANPYAPQGAPPVTLAESLTQCALHSHYHRAQNAARLRELGGEPANTDLISWYWSGREEPRWS